MATVPPVRPGQGLPSFEILSRLRLPQTLQKSSPLRQYSAWELCARCQGCVPDFGAGAHGWLGSRRAPGAAPPFSTALTRSGHACRASSSR